MDSVVEVTALSLKQQLPETVSPGLISYTRESVRILNRKQLEDAACDCYGIVQR